MIDRLRKLGAMCDAYRWVLIAEAAVARGRTFEEAIDVADGVLQAYLRALPPRTSEADATQPAPAGPAHAPVIANRGALQLTRPAS